MTETENTQPSPLEVEEDRLRREALAQVEAGPVEGETCNCGRADDHDHGGPS